MSVHNKLPRREWLGMTGAAAALAIASELRQLKGEEPKRPKVAAVVTEFTYRSHAHVILENFLKPYYFNGERTDPGVDVASLYVDQFPSGDLSRSAAKEFGFKI